MINIAIVGANSYIGKSFSDYVIKCQPDSKISTVDTIDGKWKDFDFSGYDVAIVVAGIAHIKETAENAHLYYEINRDMVIEIAKNIKQSGAKQLIFLSTMSVYGKVIGYISKNDIPEPVTNYGKSKLQAEEELKKMENDNFKVAVIRPPMVYGKGCKGNYNILSKAAKKLPIFPEYKNSRSMIYIENLCEFILQIVQKGLSGVFLPQDKEYICTSDMVRLIAANSNKKMVFTKMFNPFIKMLRINLINKVFGNLTYEKIDYGFEYNTMKELSEAISEIEG